MKTLFTTVSPAGLLLIACLAVVTVAQTSTPYKVSAEQVRELLHRLDEHAESYRSLVDILLEVSRLDGTPREERLDLLVQEFEREVDGLEARFNTGATTVADVERVLRAAGRVDAPLTRALSDQSLSPDASLRERAQTEWALLKSSLKNLADFYNIKWELGDPRAGAGRH
jgi:ribosomal protein L16 Arg81 hydroxylase